MKIQIRKEVFETNSSSTHSFVICTDSEYEQWRNGELVFYGNIAYCDGKLITLEEALEESKSDDYFCEEDIHTFEDWEHYDGFLNHFKEEYITPGGEKIHIFGAYGHD